MSSSRDFYKVLILSQSGKGKTFSARNLDPQKTGFINIENKPLPFRAPFKYHGKPKAYTGALNALRDYSANPEIETIFVDSLSAFSDLLLEEMREKYKGFDIWSNYNTKIAEFLKLVKLAEKEVFVTGHYEILNIEGAPEKRAKVKAKEWEGLIEKEFTVVLYADSKFKDNKNEHFFVTQGDGLSAKCPPDLLDNLTKIPNDCKVILEKILKFAGQPA
jgi:hypothetical protein